MKFTGEKLQKILNSQTGSLTLEDRHGGIYDRCEVLVVANYALHNSCTGFGKFGHVYRVVSNDAPRRQPFATRLDLVKELTTFRRLPRVTRAYQEPGALTWVPQLVDADSGRVGRTSTINFKD